MSEYKKFLCLVVDRKTMKTISEYEIDAYSDWDARNKVVALFERKQSYRPIFRVYTDWFVDSCEI